MVQRKRQDDGLTDEEYLERAGVWRLHVALPICALMLALLGIAVILGRSLGPPKGSPDQGVRKIAPEVPSATPHPPRPCTAPAPAPSVAPPVGEPPRIAHAHVRRRRS